MHISGSAANRGQSSGFCLVRTLFCVIFALLHCCGETLSDTLSLFESCDSFQVVFIEIYLAFPVFADRILGLCSSRLSVSARKNPDVRFFEILSLWKIYHLPVGITDWQPACTGNVFFWRPICGA